MFEVPQRQQLASGGGGLRSLCSLRPLPPFPADPTNAKLVSCGPFPPTPSRALGTGNALLWYGRDTRCAKQAPTVRDAFSEAFGVKNRLLRYGRDIRCQKQPSMVRDASSKANRTAPATSNASPKARRTAPAAPNAFSGARCMKTPSCCTEAHLQCAERPPRGGGQT